MDKIAIKKEVLGRFLDLIQISGETANNEALLLVEDSKITSYVISATKIVGIRAIWKGKFAPWNSIGIDNITLLKNILSTFSDEEIVLTRQINKLSITSTSNKVIAKIILRAPEYIVNTIESKKFDGVLAQASSDMFNLDKDCVNLIVNYTNKIKSGDLVLEGNKGEIKVKLEKNENELIASFPIPPTVEPFSVKVSKVFVDVLSTANSSIGVSFKDEKPISVNVTEGDLEVSYIIAPLKK